MKSFIKIAFTAAVLTLTACADSKSTANPEVPGSAKASAMAQEFENIDGTVFGIWDAGEIESPTDGTKVAFTVYYAKNKYGFKATCTREGEVLVASLAVLAKTTKNTVEILEDAEGKTINDKGACSISVQPYVERYKLLDNDHLEITVESQSFVYKRIK